MKYSIITINLNNCNGLQKTIKSVANQTCRDFEYIIIDGGSTDGSVEVIKDYTDRIDYWVSEPDKGIYNAMNKGILKAHGDYLLFLNSGDLMYNNNVLEKCSMLLDKDIVVGYITRMDGKSEAHYNQQDITMMHFFHGHLPHQAMFFKKDLFKDKLYDENYRIVSDWKFYMEQLVYNDCSFKAIDINIAIFDCDGISNRNKDVTYLEKQDVLQKTLPRRIYMDYSRYENKESPILDLIPLFNRTYRLQKLIIFCVKCILKIYKIKNLFK